jgi:hypothetical protein
MVSSFITIEETPTYKIEEIKHIGATRKYN